MSRLVLPSRFALVGLFCALLHNAIMIGLDRWHVHYALSAVISFAVVALAGYALHVSFTFRERASLASAWRYTAGMAANYPVTVALLFVMCDVAGLPMAIASPLATVAMFGWNYLASRWAIVRTSRTAPANRERPT
jgi:putative flippase GtrA